jgi:hypothetical protein
MPLKFLKDAPMIKIEKFREFYLDFAHVAGSN